jgi:hypothetical protein
MLVLTQYDKNKKITPEWDDLLAFEFTKYI